MLLYAVTIFVSAFLLFLVQPVMAKQILPWFGGSAAVWTTCLVFFQTTLLAGYAYSDLVVHRLAPRPQVRLHVALLVVSLIALPIVPGAGWKPIGGENPSWLILGLLAVTIGLPYFLLATTSPLIQAWFARARPGTSPYRLFALSNLASMLALVGYPFLLEPWAPTRAQAWGWSTAYALFVALCAAAGWASLRAARTPAIVELATTAEPAVGDGPAERPPTPARQLLWCTLAAMGSVLLLAVSNHITVDIASIPLLWIAPLAIYLLTFILCFDARGWYRRDVLLAMAAAALGVMGWTQADPKLRHELALQIGVFCTGLFIGCMFCHGELVRLKPAPRYLTRFYLMISLGGALGAVLVGLVAPFVLPAHFELALGLVGVALLLAWQVRHVHRVYLALAAAAVLATIGTGIWSVREFYDDVIVSQRNFYGVLRVTEWGAGDEVNHRRSLIHGQIMHGQQFLAPDLKGQPTSYYTATSGIGRLLESLHPRKDPLKVGVIGLGAGTIATYGAKGDTYRFYDINPDVMTIAQRDFSYLRDSDATIELVLGDARLSLEREPPQGFDVLAVDAFSSDAIPVHLITSEALAVYRRHMKPGGVIAFHVTNRYLDLAPVVQALADAQGLSALQIRDETNDGMTSTSDWILLSDDPAALAKPELADFATPIEPHPDWRPWTDDFNNLVQVLK
jgi:SAM-dependent methyltransferase